MKSALKILFVSLLGLSVSFCSSTPDNYEEEQPKYDDYSSSGVYNDIEGESRTVSSTDYEDDDYGDAGASSADEEDELFLGGTENAQDTEEEDNSEPAAMEEASNAIKELPVETLEPTPRKKASISAFKNGMYKFSKACNMREEPSKSGSKAGKVSTKRKLWVEGHNDNWVTVQKKSGPVYVHRSCL